MGGNRVGKRKSGNKQVSEVKLSKGKKRSISTVVADQLSPGTTKFKKQSNSKRTRSNSSILVGFGTHKELMMTIITAL